MISYCKRVDINMNIDDSLKKMLGKAKTKGASVNMQKQWNNFNFGQKNSMRLKFPDNDGDRIPNKWDCQPNNVFRQDFKPSRFRDSDTMTAALKFGGKNLQGLTKLGAGRDRDVYALDKDKVLKVAKNPGGLTQNTSESDLEFLGMGKQLEAGKDYVVMERQKSLSKQGRQKLATIRSAISKLPTDNRGKKELFHLTGDDGVLEKTGIGTDILNYEINPNEVFANRQWGEDKEGNLRLVDGGALQDDVSLRRYRVKDFQQVANIDRSATPPWQLKEWQEIQQQRKQFKDKGTFEGKHEGAREPYFERLSTFPIVSEKDIQEKAIQSVDKIEEVDDYGCSLGHCTEISRDLKKSLESQGMPIEEKTIRAYKDDTILHTSLYDPNRNIYIDTQTYQYTGEEPKPIDERKVIFTPDEYRSMGFKEDFDIEEKLEDDKYEKID
jgi:hypothetical protein